MEGLRHRLNTLTFKISNQCSELSKNVYQLSSNAQSNSMGIYFSLVASAILFSIFSGIWISKRLSEPISTLTGLVENSKGSESPARIEYKLKNAANEIQSLFRAFTMLTEKTEEQMKEIKSKSKLLKAKNYELKQLNKELDNFLYSTAHDLRSPLSSLLGLLNLLKYEDRKENLDAYYGMMQSSIHRMETFISQIVNYSKNKRLSLLLEEVSLHKIIHDVVEAHKFVEGASQISWHIDIKEHFLVFTDVNRITILFNNLISNAIRYADFTKEQPYIRIQIRADLNNVYIEFGDNGIGIGQEHIGKIFNMFYRAHNNSKGSGLGLYILKQTIQKLKGFIKVESEVGIGTRFFISLPNNITNVTREHELPLMESLA